MESGLFLKSFILYMHQISSGPFDKIFTTVQPQQQQPQQPQRTPPDLQNNHHNGGIVMHVDLEHPRHHGQVGQHQQQRVGEELFLC